MTIQPLESVDTYDVRVGREIKAWLSRKDLRQKHIAEALGLSQGAASQRLIGSVSFSIHELLAISGLFEISLSELLGSDLINEKGPRPVVQDESEGRALRDSNPEPTDHTIPSTPGISR